MSQLPVLSIVLFLPLVGALGAAILPRAVGWGWALAFMLADLALALALLPVFDPNATGFQFVERVPWLPDSAINYALGLDGINLFLLPLNALLTLVAVGASWRVAREGTRSREYFALMLLLSFGMQGVFLSTNLFLFYVFWEIMLIPAYLLVGIFGGPRRAYAAIKFVLYTAVGSLLMLVGIIALGVVTTPAAHGFTLDLPALLAAGVPREAQLWLFLAFAAAFAVKAALFPLHSWVPDTYSQAPAPVVVLIAGVMAKTGAYGFVRFCLPLFPAGIQTDAGGQTVGEWIAWLAVIGIMYFAVQALVAEDMYHLLAYVSISHMGVIVLGIFAFNAQGVEGAVLQMINHGIIIAALFLLAGFIEGRTGTRRMADFGGLATRVPILATVVLIVSLAALGLPGLNSFAGEFLAFLGAFRAYLWQGAIATFVVVPAAWYMLRFFQGLTEGPPPERGPVATALFPAAGGRPSRGRRGRRGEPITMSLVDLRWSEALVLAPLLALILALGIAPGLLTARMERSVAALPAASTVPPPASLASDGRVVVLVSQTAAAAPAHATQAPTRRPPMKGATR